MIGDLLWGLIGGGIIGALGRLVLPGRQNISIIWTILLGMVAGALAGLISDWIGVRHTAGVDWIRHILQVAIAAGVIWLFLRGKERRDARAKPTMPQTP
jgi:uncharacterized membrane protein YeaQ/YmgE (transglycosylase-associated protein family)